VGEEEIVSAREIVLGKVRRGLRVTGSEPARQAAVADRLAHPHRGLVPARGQLAPEARAQLFVTMAERAQASIARLGSAAEVPAAVADYLRQHNLPAAVRRGSDQRLDGLPWDTIPQVAVGVGPTDGSDLVGLSHADGAVAETGTLVLTSGPENPTTLNFLVEHTIVVLDAKDIAGDYETIWERLADKHGRGALPRTVNLVTGPSRTADIEQILILGAHGAKRLHILLVGAAGVSA
jgi:L-lactate dehydrogenase complex protein LldG